MANRIIIIGGAGTVGTPEKELLQGMLTAQDRQGQITWTWVTQTIAVGEVVDDETRNCRIAVVDTDALDAVRAALWATGVSDTEPREF